MELASPGLLTTLISFAVAITILVFVHEMGHYLVARRFGVRVEVFSIGFGPELFGWNDRHGTRWRVSLIPLGGYVRFFGDSDAASSADRERLARMTAEERDRAFHLKPLYQRALIVAAGPVVNILFAVLILAGHPTPDDQAALAAAEQALLPPALFVRAAGVGAILWICLRRRRQRPAALGLRSSSLPADVVIGVAATPVIFALVGTVLWTLGILWPALFRQMDENVDRLEALLPALPLGQYLLLALVIGVYEEVLFRGFLLGRLRRLTGRWWIAAAGSTLVFTLLHAGEQTGSALIAITILALALCGLTVWRRSLVPAMVSHVLWDAVQFTLLHAYPGEASA